MNKLMRIALVVTIALCLCAPALAETQITVTGTGETLVPADTAVITLGVNVQKADVLEAQDEVNVKIENMRVALIESGIAKENINTDRLRIYAVYDYSQAVEKIVGYNAYSYLAIRTTDMDVVGNIIDVAFQNGANTLDGISFSASDSEDAEKESITLAVKDAMAKAEIIAAAAGLEIKGIESITESYSYSGDSGINAFYKNAMAEDSVGGGSTMVQAAKISISANVSVIFIAN